MSVLDETADWLQIHHGLVEEIFRRFQDKGHWPTRDEIGRWAIREGRPDAYGALSAMPHPAGMVSPPDNRVELRVRALASVRAADQMVHEFVRALWLADSRLRSHDEHPELSSIDLEESLGLDPTTAGRVGTLLLTEAWMLGGGSGTADGSWRRDVTERTRFVTDVRSVSHYLELEAQHRGLHEPRGSPQPSAERRPSVPGEHLSHLDGLHQQFAERAVKQVEAGRLDVAVFEAFKSVEMRVRSLSGLRLDGVDLIRQAFKEGGPLHNRLRHSGEQEAVSHLFAGALGLLKNPFSHREVDYDEPAVALDALRLADLLHRLLDDDAARLKDHIEEYMAPREVAPALYRELYGSDAPEDPPTRVPS